MTSAMLRIAARVAMRAFREMRAVFYGRHMQCPRGALMKNSKNYYL